MPRDVVTLPQRQSIYDAYEYAPAVVGGEFLFVSGQVGVDVNGQAVADPAEQARQAFANLQDVLEAAGCTFDDVVDVTSFHVDMHAHLDAFIAAKRAVFPEQPYPAWTAIGVVSLADPALLFEVKAIARRP